MYKQALIIADNELLVRAVTAQQLAVIERVREASVQALAKGDNSLKAMRPQVVKFQQFYNYFFELENKIFEEFKNRLPSPTSVGETEEKMPELEQEIPIAPHIEKVIREEAALPRERDESSAVEEAVRDLSRLERYERRAWSRQKRAIRAFTNIRLMRLLGPTHSTPL